MTLWQHYWLLCRLQVQGKILRFIVTFPLYFHHRILFSSWNSPQRAKALSFQQLVGWACPTSAYALCQKTSCCFFPCLSAILFNLHVASFLWTKGESDLEKIRCAQPPERQRGRDRCWHPLPECHCYCGCCGLRSEKEKLSWSQITRTSYVLQCGHLLLRLKNHGIGVHCENATLGRHLLSHAHNVGLLIIKKKKKKKKKLHVVQQHSCGVNWKIREGGGEISSFSFLWEWLATHCVGVFGASCGVARTWREALQTPVHPHSMTACVRWPRGASWRRICDSGWAGRTRWIPSSPCYSRRRTNRPSRDRAGDPRSAPRTPPAAAPRSLTCSSPAKIIARTETSLEKIICSPFWGLDSFSVWRNSGDHCFGGEVHHSGETVVRVGGGGVHATMVMITWTLQAALLLSHAHKEDKRNENGKDSRAQVAPIFLAFKFLFKMTLVHTRHTPTFDMIWGTIRLSYIAVNGWNFLSDRKHGLTDLHCSQSEPHTWAKFLLRWKQGM